MADYSKMTNDDFDQILERLIEEASAGSLLSIEGAYEVFSEHFNNDVLTIWEQENPDKAFPAST